MLTISITAFVTLVIILVIANLSSGEKKIEHKIERLYASDDPQFLRSMGLLLGPPVISGNRFEMLLNGDHIFPSMLEGIRSARQTITFETFIYWSGEIGEQIAQALADKAREGIAVHVLLDWVGSSKMDKRYLDLLRDAGAEVIQYHKPHWTGLGRMNDRTHRKLLVIDGHIGFTGGVGIAPEWTGHAQNEKHWRDTHFRVAGPVVGHMQAVFMDNWVKATGNVLHGPGYFPDVESMGDGLAHMFSSSPSGGSDDMQLMYLMAITAATHSIHLASAYFVPDKLTINAIVEAAKRLDQFRQSFVQAQRRSESEHLRPRLREAANRRFCGGSNEVAAGHARSMDAPAVYGKADRKVRAAAGYATLTILLITDLRQRDRLR
jgi:cardiolipin synthase